MIDTQPDFGMCFSTKTLISTDLLSFIRSSYSVQWGHY